MTEHLSPVVEEYDGFLRDLKERIRSAQVRVALAVSHELLTLYWNVGRQLIVEQMRRGWGAKVIVRLAAHLRHTFPEMKGFSPRNLKYMRALAEAFPDAELCNGLLHKSRGDIICASWTRWMTRTSASGTSARR